MIPTLTLIPTAERANSEPASDSGDFTPEPAPRLSDWVNEGLAQAREAQRDVITAIDTWTQMLAQSARASAECQLRLFQMAQTNAAESYRLACELMEANSWPRLVELSADGARRQAETAAAQLSELSDLARKAASETAEPLSGQRLCAAASRRSNQRRVPPLPARFARRPLTQARRGKTG
jgi:hypothetical protein